MPPARRNLVVLCLTALFVIVPTRAWADPTVRLLTGSTGVLVTDPSNSGLSNAELGLSLRADVNNVANRVDFRADYLARMGFVDLGLWLRDGDKGNASVHHLRELSANIRLARPVRLKLGRLPTPGDFWLIVDGAKLEVDYASWLTHSVYGGLRAFSSGFRETHLTRSPTVLGLAGSALNLHTANVDAELLFTWAMDRLDVPNQLEGDRLVLEPHVENGYFLQASTSVRPTLRTLVLGGARLGTRYDVQFDAVTPFGPTRIGSASLASVNAWALGEWGPSALEGRLRLQYQFNFQRINVFQSELIGTGSGGAALSAEDGDFHEHGARALGMLTKTMRGDLGYRLRFRQNGNREHHVAAGLRDSRLLGNFGYVGHVDFGIISPATIFFAPEVKTYVRGVYALAATYIDDRFDARLGIHFIDAIGSNMLSSQYPTPDSGVLKTQLFPFAFETNRVVVASFFYTGTRFFCGVDLEESIVSWQLRALAQVGMAQ